MRAGKDPVSGDDMYVGFCVDLTKKISSIVGIKYKIVPVKDGRYGSVDENGTWDGMVGELVRNVSISCRHGNRCCR